MVTKIVLVVEDEEHLNNILCVFLQKKSFATKSACSFKEAVGLLKSGLEFDLIVLDYNLGDGTGDDFLVSLQKYYQGTIAPPVMMVSGNDDPVFIEQCFSKGIYDYLIKPINYSLFAIKVMSLIKIVEMQGLIVAQNKELQRFKRDSEQEQLVAKFTYEYLLQQNNQLIEGVTSWLKPLLAFSGDIVLTQMSPEEDFYFLLADATGHGLSAAITLLPVVNVFNTMVSKGFDVKSIVAEINKKLVRDTPDFRFVAAVLIRWRFADGMLDVWNGGMPAVHWMKNGHVFNQFESRHMALGILGEDLFDNSVVSCPVDGCGELIAYTDGLIEAANNNDVRFSMQGVIDNLCANSDAQLEALVEALNRHVEGQGFNDDILICKIDLHRIESAHKTRATGSL